MRALYCKPNFVYSTSLRVTVAESATLDVNSRRSAKPMLHIGVFAKGAAWETVVKEKRGRYWAHCGRYWAQCGGERHPSLLTLDLRKLLSPVGTDGEANEPVGVDKHGVVRSRANGQRSSLLRLTMEADIEHHTLEISASSTSKNGSFRHHKTRTFGHKPFPLVEAWHLGFCTTMSSEELGLEIVDAPQKKHRNIPLRRYTSRCPPPRRICGTS